MCSSNERSWNYVVRSLGEVDTLASVHTVPKFRVSWDARDMSLADAECRSDDGPDDVGNLLESTQSKCLETRAFAVSGDLATSIAHICCVAAVRPIDVDLLLCASARTAFVTEASEMIAVPILHCIDVQTGDEGLLRADSLT